MGAAIRLGGVQDGTIWAWREACFIRLSDKTLIKSVKRHFLVTL
ncbi:hypothetical protein J2792_001826 [Novosphingobium capsulatum]|jgi:hypothetical protein|uniref:Transposase n=1 Tax=Novosphingobium capsulatum TaxID=13688 RepID=A0ABU1MKT5_9SPHN|nr:hypothetical protein [Novosphingobium capsulatum]